MPVRLGLGQFKNWSRLVVHSLICVLVELEFLGENPRASRLINCFISLVFQDRPINGQGHRLMASNVVARPRIRLNGLRGPLGRQI